MFNLLSQKYPDKPKVFLGKAKMLDKYSANMKCNKLAEEALEAYKRYLAFGNIVTNNEEYRATAQRCIELMQFMGFFMQTLSIHELLVERFSDDPSIKTQLADTYLVINRYADAKNVLEDVLHRWPMEGLAQALYGFTILVHDKDYNMGVKYLQQGIESRAEGTQKGVFYVNLGSALQRLGYQAEALRVYDEGVNLKLFPSLYQRSLYNEPNLRAQPFWMIDDTPHGYRFNELEQNWLAIRSEGLHLLSKSGYFEDDEENLLDSGGWKQFNLFVRGNRIQKNCQKAPITCGLIKNFQAASDCRRGQVKFSVIHPGTHIYPHCGPTNSRLRAHLGLIVPNGTRLRVAETEKNWIEGKILIFDDSFEHEVWHNGSSLRLVLIVDFWHPDLNERQRRHLTSI